MKTTFRISDKQIIKEAIKEFIGESVITDINETISIIEMAQFFDIPIEEIRDIINII